MRLFKSLVLLALLFGSLAAQSKFNTEKLDSLINKIYNDFELTGLSIGILKDSTIIFNKGYGYKEWNTDELVDTETLFGIASLSKAFTAASIGILVDEGKLDWNDRVIDYIPWFQLSDPYVTRELRIVDLLTHRAGFSTFDGDLLWYGTNYSREEILKRFKEMPLKKSFRSEYGYSNIMFLAAGEVIEEVTGKSWDDFVTERIFIPLEMTSTNTSTKQFTENSNVAYPHLGREKLDFLNYDNIGAAASINSTSSDMLKWGMMWLNKGEYKGKEILTEKTVDRILSSYQAINVGNSSKINERHFLNTAMGWFLEDRNGRKIIHHSGGLIGYISRFAIVPEDNLSIIVLTNDEAYMIPPLMNYLFDVFAGNLKDEDYFERSLNYFKGKEERESKRKKELEENRAKETSPSQTIESFAGIYIDKMYGDAEIKIENDKLHLTLLPAKELFNTELNHWHFDTFSFKFADPFLPEGMITFETNKEGKISGFKIDLPNPDFHFYNLHFIKKD